MEKRILILFIRRSPSWLFVGELGKKYDLLLVLKHEERRRGQGERGREKEVYILETTQTNVSEHFLLFLIENVVFLG